MSTIDVRNKQDLKTQYPVYTKKNTIWKNRINWEAIEQSNTSIVTHYGSYTFIEAIKEGKIWYWVVKDNNKTFRIKRTQLFNKRLPKGIEVIEIPSAFTFKYQLCLPPAREYIDILVEEANRFVPQLNSMTIQRILSSPKNYTPKGKLKKAAAKWVEELENDKGCTLTASDNSLEDFRCKVIHLIQTYPDLCEYNIMQGNEIDKRYKKLLASVHPDKTHRDTSEEFSLVKEWCR